MSDSQFFSRLGHNTYSFSQLIVKSRLVEALNDGIARYPIHRELRLAARIELEVLFDQIALDDSWRAQRLDTYSMLLDSQGCFVSASGGRTGDYSSCSFSIWAASPEKAEQAKKEN